MFKLGLCSVTFRNLTVEQVIHLASKAKLDGIEWGGDVHVPLGQLDNAKDVAKLTKQANIDVASYGSYYRVEVVDENEYPFEQVLETAIELEAPSIRVWAGTLGSNEADQSYRQNVINDARRIASLAKDKGVAIHLEYHGGTLTDTKESAKQLMEEINHPNVHIYWQPVVGATAEERIASINAVHPWLSDVHVFQWTTTERLALSEGKEEWTHYLRQIKRDEKKRYLFMEFVKDDNEEQFLQDAKVLHNLVLND